MSRRDPSLPKEVYDQQGRTAKKEKKKKEKKKKKKKKDEGFEGARESRSNEISKPSVELINPRAVRRK